MPRAPLATLWKVFTASCSCFHAACLLSAAEPDVAAPAADGETAAAAYSAVSPTVEAARAIPGTGVPRTSTAPGAAAAAGISAAPAKYVAAPLGFAISAG